MKPAQPLEITSCPLTGRNLIEASAGTGKTYTIAALFVRLIVEKGLGVEQVLVVTFTRAATAELRERLYTALLQARNFLQGQAPAEPYLLALQVTDPQEQEQRLQRLQRALRDFDEAGIYTIHSFCQRMLVEHAFASSSLQEVEVSGDQAALIMEALRDFWRQRLTSAPLQVVPELLKLGLAGFFRLYGHKERNPQITIRGGEGLNPVTLSEELQQAHQSLKEHCADLRHYFPPDLDEAMAMVAHERQKPKIRKDLLRKGAEQIQAWQASDEELIPAELLKALQRYSVEELLFRFAEGDMPGHPALISASAVLKTYDYYQGLKEGLLVCYQQQMFSFVEQRLKASKEEKNLFAFNDFLEAMASQLARTNQGGDLARAVRRRFKAALIDEFQDTDPLQYTIFSTIFTGKSSLFLIGDPKQAIYSFRGADIYAYLQAARQAGQCYTLPINYRSDQALVKAINLLFGPQLNSNPFAEAEIRFQAVASHISDSPLHIDEAEQAPLRIWCPTDEQLDNQQLTASLLEPLLARAITDEIGRLLALAAQGRASLTSSQGRRALAPGDFAVLTRNRQQMEEVGHCLSLAGIPVVQSSATSIYDSDEAFFMELLLLALLEPGRLSRLKAWLAHPVFGLSADFFASEQGGWLLWQGRLQQLHERFSRHGFLALFRDLLLLDDLKPRLLARPRGERCLTNLQQLAEIIHTRQQHKGASLSLLASWFARQRQEPLLREEEAELRMESDEQAVQLVTIHKSKGLEYPIVFAPYVWSSSEAKDPLVHEQGKRQLFLDQQQFGPRRQQAMQEALAENLRLFYVALTRARHRCYTMWGRFSSRSRVHTSAPAYLLHQGDQALAQEEPVQALKKNYQRFKNQAAMAKHLTSLFADQPLAVLPLPEKCHFQPQPEQATSQALHCRAYTPPARQHWRISSFSALSHDSHASMAQGPLLASPPAPDQEELTIHSFPKGARAGTFLHELLEELDFSQPLGQQASELIANGLKRYGFEPQWRQPVLAMLERLFQQPLAGFKLADISLAQRFTELEFYFPLAQLEPASLQQLFATGSGPGPEQLFARQSKGLTFAPCHGYMHGFIDLVFCHGGRYYLLDWKSNHLGDRSQAYQQDALVQAMADNHYYLQYHLYTLALHQHLTLTLPDYDYEHHFGGVYYLFLRGIEPCAAGELGVFFARPTASMVGQMAATLLSGGGNDAS